MAVTINYLLQDSKVLIEAVDGKREQMAEKGFSEEKYGELTNARENLRLKELEQQKAVEAAENLTAEQNKEIANVGRLINSVRNAARSAYGTDAAGLKLFKVDVRIPKSVKSLCTLTEYMISIINEKKELLLKNGLTEEDISQISASYASLLSTDTAQEQSKKLQKAATAERNAAAKVLKEQLFKTRNFAKVCFANDEASLVLFKSLPKGRGGSKDTGEEEGDTN